MSSHTELTLAFIGGAPDSAAAEMQKLPIHEGAALLESIPVRLSAPLLVLMIPWNAARLLETVSPSRAAELLRQLGFLDAVSLSRLVSTDVRAEILDGLPTKLGRRLTSALRYPIYQVGAWVDSDVPTLSIGDTVSDAMNILRSGSSASHVFLESEPHGEFVGIVATRELLTADPSTRLGQLHYSRVQPIANRASLSSVAFDERWDESIHLPVVGRRGNLLGGLSRRALRQATHENFTVSKARKPYMMREVLVAFGVVVFGLVKLIADSGAPSGERQAGVSNE